jgi:hypothetical protein
MAELIHRHSMTLRDQRGDRFYAAVYGQPREDGYWEGWLQFAQVDGYAVLRTERETVQSSQANLTSWALGLEPAYLEGAFSRAQARLARSVPADLSSERLPR